MADTQNFDQLNILKRRSLPYYEYFGDMELTKEQKKNREALAVLLEDAIMIFFMLVDSELTEIRAKQELVNSLYEVLDDKPYFETEEQKNKYIIDLVNETYRSTVENLAKYPHDYDYTGNSLYWVSEDRAQFIAENEANTLMNGKEYFDAIKQGKKNKIWKTYWDDKVRPTHVEVDVTMLPINEYFTVGAALMLYPKDLTSEFSTGSEHPEEYINCRCQCLYT